MHGPKWLSAPRALPDVCTKLTALTDIPVSLNLSFLWGTPVRDGREAAIGAVSQGVFCYL